MGNLDRIRQKVLSGTADKNVPFNDLLTLAQSLPLNHRGGGKHPHLFTGSDKNKRPIFLNLQPDKSNKAKPYQVKQVRDAIFRLES